MRERDDVSGRIFHISDRPDLQLFEPRIAPTDPEQRAVVWAVDEDHLGHYLVPRDCPRVCFRAGPGSAPADIDELLGGDPAARVVAVEQSWVERIATTTLYRYEFAPEPFRSLDPTAGYLASNRPVEAVERVELRDLPAQLARLGYTYRVLASLWELREQVIASTLPFSIIRWRHASPRPGGEPLPIP